MRYLLLTVTILMLGVLPGCDNGLEADADELFTAVLTGASEVPAVTTIALGDADIVHDASEAHLDYELSVDDIADVTAAHIHLGAPGTNGPIIAFLFDPAAPISVVAPTIIAAGEISEADVRTAQGFDGTFTSLLQAMRAGNTYVNVHTVQNPAGEIRGQIVELDD